MPPARILTYVLILVALAAGPAQARLDPHHHGAHPAKKAKRHHKHVKAHHRRTKAHKQKHKPKHKRKHKAGRGHAKPPAPRAGRTTVVAKPVTKATPATAAKATPATLTKAPATTTKAATTTAAPTATATATPSTGGLFSATSIWNAPLAANASLDPASSSRMAAFYAEIMAEEKAAIGPYINDTYYSVPIWRVGPDQPRVHVTLDKAPFAGSPQLGWDANGGVPIPGNAAPAPGTDAPMVVYQASSDTMWEFWRAVKKSDGWHASWGGTMRNVSTNPGYYSNAAFPGLTSSQGWGWGVTASSLPIAGGIITAQDLRQGHIDHALAMAVPNACAKRFDFPAQRTDGSSSDANCLPEGAHLRLDPSLDLSKLKLPKMALLLAQAAQKYGFVIKDRTNHEVALSVEDPQVFGANVYAGANGLYAGSPKWDFMGKFPWKSLQLLKSKSCTTMPCTG